MNSNLALKKEDQFMLNNKKRVIVYCRESRDDYGENYERIETQRDSLLRFCEKNGYNNIIEVIMHDNVSGTDFSRLDYIKDKIISGQVDCLVMKDSSRLGRNQLEALKFTAIIEEYGIELIFENEKYDEYFSLKSWFNEMRAKDDSTKIRKTLRHKMEVGELLIRSHYGYIKEGKNLIIDDNVAWVVKKIFDLYCSGFGYRAIASILNNEKIPTPSEYKGENKKPIAEVWIGQHVRRILMNETYTGTMVSGTTTKVSYKSKKAKKTPKETWIKVENHHPAIISNEIFNQVQKIIKGKENFAPKSKTPSLFSGYLMCGRCNSPLYIVRRKDRPNAFVCGKNFKEGKIDSNIKGKGCTSHRIREKEIETIFKNHIENIMFNEQYKKELYKQYENTEFIKNNYSNTLKNLEDTLDKYKVLYEEVYQDKLDKKIPEFIFEKKAKQYEHNIKITEKQIAELKRESQNILEVETNIEKINNMYERIYKEGLKKQDLNMLINKIIVFDENEIKLEDIEKYNLTTEQYRDIYDNGGVIFDYKFNVQHVFTNRWITYLVGTNKFDIDRFIKEVIEYKGVS